MFKSVKGGLGSSISTGSEHPPKGTLIDEGTEMDTGRFVTSTVYFDKEV